MKPRNFPGRKYDRRKKALERLKKQASGSWLHPNEPTQHQTHEIMVLQQRTQGSRPMSSQEVRAT